MHPSLQAEDSCYSTAADSQLLILIQMTDGEDVTKEYLQARKAETQQKRYCSCYFLAMLSIISV